MQPLSPLSGCLAVAHQHLALQHAEFIRWLEGLLLCILSLHSCLSWCSDEAHVLARCTIRSESIGPCPGPSFAFDLNHLLALLPDSGYLNSMVSEALLKPLRRYFAFSRITSCAHLVTLITLTKHLKLVSAMLPIALCRAMSVSFVSLLFSLILVCFHVLPWPY